MTKNDSLKEEVKTEDAPEIERNIETTRAQMGATLDELHGKLNPAVLKDQALEQFQQAKAQLKADLASELTEVKQILRNELREAKDGLREATIGKVEHMVDDAQDTVKRTSSSIFDTMRDNPIPTALVGIGLGWLFVNARARSIGRLDGRSNAQAYGAYGRNGSKLRDGATVEGTARRIGSSAKGLARQVGSKAGELADEATSAVKTRAAGAAEAISSEAEDVARRAAGVGNAVNARVHDAEDFAVRAGESAMMVVHEAGDRAVEWEGAIERAMRENPLAAGAVAVALGMAVGLGIPSTRTEDELVGRVRDRALERVTTLADDALGEVESVAGRLVEGDSKGDASASV